MAQFTLLGLNNHINYLIERGSLEELLEFLGMQYYDGSRKHGNESRDVYEFIETGTLAIEVLLEESKVRFWSNLSEWYNLPKKYSFWYLFFGQYLKLAKRLMELLNEKYSSLGSLAYELKLDGKFRGFSLGYGVFEGRETEDYFLELLD